MKNLINEVKNQKLVNAIADFNVTMIFFEEGELNIRSYYPIPMDWASAFEAELSAHK